MTNCPAKYTYISTANFGDHKKVTQELLEELCGNDQYLKSKVTELFDMTDPECRKRFNPLILDEANSFGAVFGYTIEDGKSIPVYMFDNNEEGGFKKAVTFEFSDTPDNIYDDDLVDFDQTTAYINTAKGEATVPKGTKPKIFKNTAVIRRYNPGQKKWMPNWNNNSYWYIGYNKDKNYNLKAKWLKNELTGDIPAVCRAQTFTVINGGVLESVSLKLRVTPITGSKLIVEIRDTVSSGSNKGFPSSKVLTRQYMTFNSKGESVQSITFQNKPKLKAGHKYAIVLRSPLSDYNNCYWIGGWSKHCNEDPYKYGDAFLSENNGYTWTRYGKGDKVRYHDGRYAPVDFLFECHIKQTYSEYKTRASENDFYYVYLKPFFTNPIKELSVFCNWTNLDTTKHKVIIEISRNGKDWEELTEAENWTKSYASNIIEKPFLFVRVGMNTSDSSTAPSLGTITVTAKTVPQTKAYVRTQFYSPRMTGMLASHIWSEVNAPYIIENTEKSTAEIDIIQNKDDKEYFKILEPTLDYLHAPTDDVGNLTKRSYVQEYQTEYSDYFTISDYENATKNDTNLKTWIENNYVTYHEAATDFITWLKENNVYLKGDFSDDISDTDIAGQPYFTYIELDNSPAYPLCDVFVTPNFTYDIISVFDAITYVTDANNTKDNIVLNNYNEDAADESTSSSNLSSSNDATIDNETLQEILNSYTESQLTTYWKTSVSNTNVLADSTGGKELANDLLKNNIYIDQVNNSTGQSLDDLKQTSYVEWCDFDVDYDNDRIRFFTKSDDDMEVKGNLPVGELVVAYNPLWVKGITADEMPLKMDLWIESFLASDNQKTYTTKVAPQDNIRQILLYEGENNETELIEDTDFTVDYINNIITFKEALPENTPVTVRYTPNLTDESLAIAYRLDRQNTTNQIYVKGNYFTTRT